MNFPLLTELSLMMAQTFLLSLGELNLNLSITQEDTDYH